MRLCLSSMWGTWHSILWNCEELERIHTTDSRPKISQMSADVSLENLESVDIWDIYSVYLRLCEWTCSTFQCAFTAPTQRDTFKRIIAAITSLTYNCIVIQRFNVGPDGMPTNGDNWREIKDGKKWNTYTFLLFTSVFTSLGDFVRNIVTHWAQLDAPESRRHRTHLRLFSNHGRMNGYAFTQMFNDANMKCSKIFEFGCAAHRLRQGLFRTSSDFIVCKLHEWRSIYMRSRAWSVQCKPDVIRLGIKNIH